MITKEDYRKAREEISIESLLNSYNVKNNGKLYSCPFHEDSTPSAGIRNNRLHCFSCGITASTIDIVCHIDHVDQFHAILKLLEGKAGAKIEPYKRKNKTVEVDRYDNIIKYANPINSTNKGYIMQYLNKRCIAEILKFQNFFGMEIKHNYYKNKNYIIYDFPNKKFAIKKAIDGTYKGNIGSVMPLYFKHDNSPIWYIVEGLEDCFSISLLQGSFKNVICLNSIANIPKMINKILLDRSYFGDNPRFIIATDTDFAGQKAKSDIIENMKKIGCNAYDYKKFYDYAEKNNLKDVNDCLIHIKTINKRKGVK